MAGRARRRQLRAPSRRRCGATSSSRAPTRRASTPSIPYDALLADYDFGLTVARVREVFGRARRGAAAAGRAGRRRARGARAGRAGRRAGGGGARRARRASASTTRAGGSTSRRTRSPRGSARGDIRLTTRYEDGQLESVLAALHEFGHGAVRAPGRRPRSRARTSAPARRCRSTSRRASCGRTTSGATRAFAGVIAAELGGGRLRVDAGDLHAALDAGAPVAHPRLGRPGDLPAAHRAALRARGRADRGHARRRRPAGGVERRHAAPARRRGARRRVTASCRTSTGPAARSATSRATRSGCLIAAQLWERLERGPRRRRTRRSPPARSARSATGSREHVHRYGRRLDTEPLLEQATGRGLDVEPFLRHVALRRRR